MDGVQDSGRAGYHMESGFEETADGDAAWEFGNARCYYAGEVEESGGAGGC